MKICWLMYRGNMFCGGQGIYLYYLTRELVKLGHEVHVLAGPPYPEVVEGVRLHKLESLNLYDRIFYSDGGFLPADQPFRVFTPLNLFEVVATRLGMFPEIFTFSVRAYSKLRELLAQHGFDIIHDNQTLGYGLLLMKTFNIPLVATIHHPLPIDREADIAQASGFREKLRRIMFYPFFMQHVVSRRMDRIITDSKSSTERIVNTFSVPRHSLRLVYPGVDIEMFNRRDGIQGQPNSLIMVGNTEDRKKGVIYLLKAIKLLKQEMDIKLTIVDRGEPYTTRAPKLVKEYGLSDVVTFTGRISVEELVRKYCQAEIAVTASVYEGFGLPAAEAMACGAPVVATRAGALPEVVDDGKSGILVPPGNEFALAKAIKELLGNAELRRRMGAEGRKRVERLFTWKEAAKDLLEVYQEVMREKNASKG